MKPKSILHLPGISVLPVVIRPIPAFQTLRFVPAALGAGQGYEVMNAGIDFGGLLCFCVDWYADNKIKICFLFLFILYSRGSHASSGSRLTLVASRCVTIYALDDNHDI